MKSTVNHIQLCVDRSNFSFYKELMSFLGWDVIMEMDEIIGFSSEGSSSVWFSHRTKETANDYDGVGMNHLGILVDSAEDVDSVANFLKEKEINPLFDTPRHRQDFAGENGVYYQVMFETPDKLLFEVMHTK